MRRARPTGSACLAKTIDTQNSAYSELQRRSLRAPSSDLRILGRRIWEKCSAATVNARGAGVLWCRRACCKPLRDCRNAQSSWLSLSPRAMPIRTLAAGRQIALGNGRLEFGFFCSGDQSADIETRGNRNPQCLAISGQLRRTGLLAGSERSDRPFPPMTSEGEILSEANLSMLRYR